MPRPITTSKLIALALCLFVLAAVADNMTQPTNPTRDWVGEHGEYRLYIDLG